MNPLVSHANYRKNHSATHNPGNRAAWKISLSGYVQSVGFRPFIYRLAIEHNLNGWVKNCVGEVQIHIEGDERQARQFIDEIFERKPPIAKPVLENFSATASAGCSSFSIYDSKSTGKAGISIPADLYICEECLEEMNNPAVRRYHYPFINCTQCGPRYTLIQSLPYDRSNTTMSGFEMCAQCEQEYQNPNKRRFHAEPIACPDCGPKLSFEYTGKSNTVEISEEAIQETTRALGEGKIVAVKGIGGYHLVCDATDAIAVQSLRDRKPRPHKPLAVMFPAPANATFKFAEQYLDLSQIDKYFLKQPSRPLLLVAKKAGSTLAANIAPGLNEVGVMLPYSPLHHLLLNDFGKPVVATSANISGDPVLIDNDMVRDKLSQVTDACLHHNRPIERPADDPVYRTIAHHQRPIRLGRGISPLELTLPVTLEQPVLAVGSQMKNTVALAWSNHVVVSPHIGEMGSVRSLEVFEKAVEDLQQLYQVNYNAIICDAHPAYTTSRWAFRQNTPVHPVLHHHAHASASWFECNTQREVIMFSWDGVGLGSDSDEGKLLWGGETFIGKPGHWQRIASMKPFSLPGGDKAGREPWRSAAAICWETGRPYHFDNSELVKLAWEKKINTPRTSSVGRLFDAAAALTGIRRIASFEGQGPMELEACCDPVKQISEQQNTLELGYEAGEVLQTDWAPLIDMLQDDARTISERANLFHLSMAHVMLQHAMLMREKYGLTRVGFSGGVFQNRVLVELAMHLLDKNGFQVCYPSLIPVNDAGISFGQIIEYAYMQSTN